MTCIRMLVIDEADRMTDTENLAVVMDVFKAIPKVVCNVNALRLVADRV